MKTLVELFEREGGHIIALFSFAFICVITAAILDYNKVSQSLTADMVKVGFGECLGALMYAMKGSGKPTTPEPPKAP